MQNWYLKKAEFYLKNNEKDLAVDRCQWVLSRSKNKLIAEKARTILSKVQEQDYLSPLK